MTARANVAKPSRSRRNEIHTIAAAALSCDGNAFSLGFINEAWIKTNIPPINGKLFGVYFEQIVVPMCKSGSRISAILVVRSREVVDWIEPKSIWLLWRKRSESLQTFGKVIGIESGSEMGAQLVI